MFVFSCLPETVGAFGIPHQKNLLQDFLNEAKHELVLEKSSLDFEIGSKKPVDDRINQFQSVLNSYTPIRSLSLIASQEEMNSLFHCVVSAGEANYNNPSTPLELLNQIEKQRQFDLKHLPSEL